MGKIRIATKGCNTGDILAEDVFNESGLLLIARNALINDYIKNKLIQSNVQHVTIYEKIVSKGSDSTLAKEYVDNAVLLREILVEIAFGKNTDYNELLSIVEFLYFRIDAAFGILNCLSELQNVDEYTYIHSMNTAFYSMMIARFMGLSETQIKKVMECALLHDVGKMKIPLDILNKKERLTKDEFEVIKGHTIMGYRLLDETQGADEEVKLSALLHHERMDGSGYPYKVPYDRIGVYPRIIAVADVFDAMTSDRVYKTRATPFEAFHMFKTIGVGMFDTTIVNAFLINISGLYTGISVKLNNGLNGEIVYVPPHDILNPVILVNGQYIDLSHDTSVKIQALL